MWPFVRAPAKEVVLEWEPRLWSFGEQRALELKFFGEWLAVSLTSPQKEAGTHLGDWCKAAVGTWLIGDQFGKLHTEGDGE